jgi:hypothetical protein
MMHSHVRASLKAKKTRTHSLIFAQLIKQLKLSEVDSSSLG